MVCMNMGEHSWILVYTLWCMVNVSFFLVKCHVTFNLSGQPQGNKSLYQNGSEVICGSLFILIRNFDRFVII